MNKSNLVTKANTLVMAHYNTSLEELRVVRTLISMVQPQDEDFKPYIFHIAEFMNLLGVKDKSKYTEIPKITENLMRKVVKIRGEKRLLQISWLSSADYKYGEGIVELQFDPKLKPFLLDLKEKFITYKLENILRLSSKYSLRLYEILKCNEFKKICEFKLDELMEILALGKSYKWFDIKRQIIEPAQKELAEKTDIIFDYEIITQRKKVTALKITIKTNKKNVAKESSPQLALPEPKNEVNQDMDIKEDDIQTVKAEFKRLYNAELVDRFVKEMIESKGLEKVIMRVKEFPDFIKGKKIKSLGGCFKAFVMKDYVKPVSHDGTPRLHDVHVTPPEERERQEKISRGEAVPPTCNPEVSQARIQLLRDAATGKVKVDSDGNIIELSNTKV